jgi:sodium/proline symporter
MAVPFFKFYVQELEGIGPYFEQLDVMGPAFAVSFVFGFLFTRFSPKTAQKAAA